MNEKILKSFEFGKMNVVKRKSQEPSLPRKVTMNKTGNYNNWKMEIWFMRQTQKQKWNFESTIDWIPFTDNKKTLTAEKVENKFLRKISENRFFEPS